MSVVKSRPAMRWLVPGAAAVVVIGGGAALGTFSASAEPSLPPRSAAQLLVDLQTARLDGISGTVVQKADLGLPSVAELAGKVGPGLTSLVAGTHTLRVWYAGPDQARVALVDTLGETDVIRNGRDVWIWSSQSKQATHHTLSGSGAEQPRPLAGGLPTTPQEAADQALAAIGPSTEVSVGRSAKIAGRDAYELVLAPRDKSSLIGQARIAIDAKEHVPLRFEVYPKGSDNTAFEVAFTQVGFGRPAAEQFRFNPPPGTKVSEGSDRPGLVPGLDLGEKPAPGVRDRADHGEGPEPTTVGEGWTTVVVGKLGGAPDKADAQAQGLLNVLPRVDGAWGSGRLLSSRLFSVLLTDDGRVLAGAVGPERLYEVAATAK